jgi:hypothetical protein
MSDPWVAKAGFDGFLYGAYVSVLVSYVNINVIVFRFWLIVSAIFFIFWATQPGFNLQIDILMFSILFILINIVMMIPLIKQKLPVKLTPIEEELYDRDFKSHMNHSQFKRFISKFKALRYSDKAQLCANKSQFTHMYYIAKILPGWKIQLKSQGDVAFKSIPEGGWIGTIEYVLYENEKAKKDSKKDTSEVIVSWGITAEITKEAEIGSENYSEQQINQEKCEENNDSDRIVNPSGAIIYKIDIEVSYLLIKSSIEIS